MTPRPLLALLAPAATSVALLTGCGGDDSGSKVAELAPPGTPIFVEAALRPEGQLKEDADAAAQKIAGVEDLGAFIVEELESSASEDGEPVDFEREVEPWLGDHGAAFWDSGDTDEANLIVETTDADLTQEFIDHQVEQSKEPYESKSYEGIDYVFGGEDGDEAVGVVGGFLLATEGEQRFKQSVDAEQSGESLAGEDTFSEAISAASEGSLADVFVDVGTLLEQSDDEIDPQARQLLRNAGIDPSEATAVASIVPGADQITVELSSDLGGQEAPTGDASELLGSLPGDSFAAFAVSGFGKQVKEAVDSLDEEGIPDTVPPGQLKNGLKELGIDLEGLTDSLQDAGAFAVGNSERSLGGALVLTTEGSEAVDAIANIGKLLRTVKVAGVTALSGKYSGFSVRSDDLGDKPLVVAAKQGRLAIGYGAAPTLRALATEAGGQTLSENRYYDAAVTALGDTPIGGFADGPAALRLADALIPADDEEFREAKKYLRNVSFLALGSASQEDLATAKLIVGLK